MSRASSLKFFRTQSPRHFVGGDWNEGGSCQREKPLSPEEVTLALLHFLYAFWGHGYGIGAPVLIQFPLIVGSFLITLFSTCLYLYGPILSTSLKLRTTSWTKNKKKNCIPRHKVSIL